MPTTVLIEPDYDGHHLQAVAHVADVAGQSSRVVLLTSHGAKEQESYAIFLADRDVEVREVFDSRRPPTSALLAELRRAAPQPTETTAVLMDGDQALKQWWLLAPMAFGLHRRPRIIFFLTRYPTRFGLFQWASWRLRVSKALLTVLAMATGTLHRAAGFAGRDDFSDGLVVKRARDPDICLAHARDRDAIRAELGLPLDRRIVGVFGVMEPRRNAPLIWEAMQRSAIDADLLLAGRQTEEVRQWVSELPPSPYGRLISYDGFLTNDLLDKLVAASDVAPIALTNNGPSGIMGKAIAAGVPVVTAGSKVRARELLAADAGLVAELTPESLGAALTEVLRGESGPRRSRLAPATADEFARRILGLPLAADRAPRGHHADAPPVR